jgi:UDP-N-acetylglucosamine transferase subunit ALG13
VIFVTVGTHHQPFARLLDALAALPGDEAIMVQHGPAEPPACAHQATPFMSFAEMIDFFREARVVVTHAGVGSILCAIRVGHTPLVVPRLHRFGEHVDDHQSELVRGLEEEGRVIAVWNMQDLAAAIAAAPSRGSEQPAIEGPLHLAVREALGGPRGAGFRARARTVQNAPESSADISA